VKKTTTDEQKAIFQWVENGQGNAIINAVAGSGKTSTVLMALRYMHGNVFFGAFNKAVADEIKAKAAQLKTPGRVTVNTLHAEGFRYMRQAYKNSTLTKDKYQDILDRLILEDDNPFSREFKEPGFYRFRYLVSRAVALGRQWLLTPDSDGDRWIALLEHFGITDEVKQERHVLTIIENARVLLREGLKEIATDFDFEDVIYGPACLPEFQEKITPLYDWVIVDEAQDTNDSRRKFLKTLLKPGGRFLAVGDPYQAIYGFAGANHDSLELIKEDFDCQNEFSLSVTFRCPKLIIDRVKLYVPHIKAHENNEDGEIINHDAEHFSLSEYLAFETFRGGDAILCRNTKQLVQAYFALLKRDIQCYVEGSDLGKDYLHVLSQFEGNTHLTTMRKELLDRLNKQKAEVTGPDRKTPASVRELQKLDNLQDKSETLIDLSYNFDTFLQLREFFKKAFRDTKDSDLSRIVTLSTVHKAKGKEWDRVFLIGRRELMPSQYAVKAWQKQQEDNLVYVALTRAKKTLIEVPAKEARHS
jgi:superfamily I DNA/RNA helicase